MVRTGRRSTNLGREPDRLNCRYDARVESATRPSPRDRIAPRPHGVIRRDGPRLFACKPLYDVPVKNDFDLDKEWEADSIEYLAGVLQACGLPPETKEPEPQS